MSSNSASSCLVLKFFSAAESGILPSPQGRCLNRASWTLQEAIWSCVSNPSLLPLASPRCNTLPWGKVTVGWPRDPVFSQKEGTWARRLPACPFPHGCRKPYLESPCWKLSMLSLMHTQQYFSLLPSGHGKPRISSCLLETQAKVFHTLWLLFLHPDQVPRGWAGPSAVGTLRGAQVLSKSPGTHPLPSAQVSDSYWVAVPCVLHWEQ